MKGDERGDGTFPCSVGRFCKRMKIDISSVHK